MNEWEVDTWMMNGYEFMDGYITEWLNGWMDG